MTEIETSLYHYRAVIREVYDGDTVTVDIDQGFGDWKLGQKLRLFGVDTPELRGAERPDGLRVRNQVRQWLPDGEPVIIETLKDRSGKYGRWLAIIWPSGWLYSVNELLLREGMATVEAYSTEDRARVALWTD